MYKVTFAESVLYAALLVLTVIYLLPAQGHC